MARLDVYGEAGGKSSSLSLPEGGGDAVGPCAGPLTGAGGGGAAFGEAGLGRASGAGAATGTFANSILVAIEVLPSAYFRLTLATVAGSCSSSSLLS